MAHHPISEPDESAPHTSRRSFLKQASGYIGATVMSPHLLSQVGGTVSDATPAASTGLMDVTLTVNGQQKTARIEPCVTLLDTLRDRLDLPGTKKGCDHGTCGACTVHVNGERVLSCLTLAVTAQGKQITTIEGLASGDKLHPVQQAFVDCDGYQCGFCTPGQIMSGVACIHEGHTRSDDEIREWMSGNLCRCAAYPNILDAIKQAAAKGASV
jgi:xanthine dehydrogenase YagT iron-sulfur-binding subunit